MRIIRVIVRRMNEACVRKARVRPGFYWVLGCSTLSAGISQISLQQTGKVQVKGRTTRMEGSLLLKS